MIIYCLVKNTIFYPLGFKLNNSTQPYIFLLQDDSTQVDLGILAAFPVHDTGRRQFIGNLSAILVLNTVLILQSKCLNFIIYQLKFRNRF